MVTDEDLQLLRDGYEAFNQGDIEVAASLVADDAVVQDRAEVPDPQTFSGRELVLKQFRAVQDEFDDYRLDLRELVVEGTCAVAALRQSGRGKLSGVPVEGDIFHVWEIDDGKMHSLRAFSTREEALAAAGAT